LAKAKPRKRDYKAEYARRIATGMSKGKTRQQARGHKPREHVARKERELREYGLTSAQKASIKKFHKQFPHEPSYPELTGYAKSHGYSEFVRYARNRRKINRQYKEQGQWESLGTDFLDDLAEDLDVPDIDWLYYH
jgi:poly-D-alanine transfer protein DltD